MDGAAVDGVAAAGAVAGDLEAVAALEASEEAALVEAARVAVGEPGEEPYDR